MSPARHFDVAERRRRMLTRHHLAAPGPDVETVAGDLVGIHSTDPATVYLSLYNRLAGFTVGDLDDALYERRTLTRILGMRRTLFVVPLDLAAVIDAACTKALVANERRRTVQLLEAAGIADPACVLETACQATLAALRAADSPLPARTLTPMLAELQTSVTLAPGKKYEAQPAITNRVCLHLSTEGHIARTRPLGSWLSSQYRWTPTERWFGQPLPVVPAADARAELVRRWLRSYGPGTTTDIAWWTKWTKRDVAAALAAVGAVEVSVEPAPDADPVPAWALPDDLDDTPPTSRVVRLLPGLDSSIMGWKGRGWYFGSSAPHLFDRNGNAGPLVLVDGRAVGAWAQRPDGTVITELTEPVAAEDLPAIAAAAASLTEWFAGVRVTPRFPNPLERRLAAG